MNNSITPTPSDPSNFEKKYNYDRDNIPTSLAPISVCGIIALAAILVIFLALVSCTENQRAKQFGGNATVDLPPNTKFIGATWKADGLWYSYRPIREGEKPESVVLKEQSSFGLIQGSVTFTEH